MDLEDGLNFCVQQFSYINCIKKNQTVKKSKYQINFCVKGSDSNNEPRVKGDEGVDA